MKIFLKRIFFPDSVDSDPSVTLYGGKCEPTIQYFESHGVIVSKIVCDGKEEKVLIDILITKSGKVVTRKFSYPVNDKVIVETFPFKSDIHVISKIVFSSYSMTETKKILFPISKF